MIKKISQPLLIFLFLLIISIPVILPYFHNGYFPTHDGEWAVVRVGDMFRSLRDHQFPVRFSGNLNFGYGYPLFNFAYPAPYYIATVFHFLKFGFVDSIKLLFSFSVIFSAFAMYLASKEMWRSKVAAMISAIFYIYLPYRIVDLYARGSIGESLSFVLFPLIIFFVSKVLDNSRERRSLCFGAICYALLILTHNIMAVLFTPLLFIFIIAKMYLTKKDKGYGTILLFIVFSYLLSAFFWIPALAEKNNILLSQIPIADRNIYFVNLDQLLVPKWGYGLPDNADGFSYQIGIPHVIVLILALFLLVYVLFTKRKMYRDFSLQIAAIFSAVALLLILLMFSFSSVIWQIMPLLKEINYPWTLLAPIGFLLSLLAGFLWLQSSLMKYSLLILSALTIILVVPYAKPQYYFDKGDGYYLTNDATTTSSQELMPLWVKKYPIERTDKKVEIMQGKGSINNSLFASNRGNFSLDLESKSTIRVNTIYYPGWKVTVDDMPVAISYKNINGVMEFPVQSGKHNVKLQFQETKLRLFSDLLSLIGFMSLLLFLLVPRKGVKK